MGTQHVMLVFIRSRCMFHEGPPTRVPTHGLACLWTVPTGSMGIGMNPGLHSEVATWLFDFGPREMHKKSR